MASKWTADQMPDLSGRVVIVTGANSGLGYESAKALAQKNADVILACRSLEKGQKAIDQIKKEVPQSHVELMKLDLGSLDSVKEFVADFQAKYPKLDVLMNNAGIMAVPKGKTADGFESQIGVNHLGHFALTGLLLDDLEKSEAARVVNVASLAADNGRINFEDLMSEGSYSTFGAYSQSKLANVLFTQELNKKLEEKGYKTRSMVAHPGGSNTNLADKSDLNPIVRVLGMGLFGLLAQPASRGALPQLYAATDPGAKPGKYYGPDGWREFKGYPKLANHPESAKNIEAQKKLWKVSEELTQVSFLSE